MKTATVFSNRICNQRCGFCTYRRESDDRAFADPRRAGAEIAAAARSGVSTLVLSGGEPTLSPGLAAHIGHAKAAGIREVVLETNGMLLAYPGRVESLAAAGVDLVRVALLAGEASVSDRLTQVPGGFVLTLRGLRNLVDAGVRAEISVALTTQNLDAVVGIPRLLAARFPEVRDILVRVVTEADGDWAPSYPQAADAIVALAEAARARGLSVRLDGRHGVPLCYFPERRRFPELFATGPPQADGSFSRIDACEACAARARCPGIASAHLAKHGAAGARAVPKREERFVLGLGRDRAEAVERELVNDAQHAYPDGRPGLERILRVNFHCNQACEFCFVDRTLPAVPDARILEEIEVAAARGVDLLSLSGGEPTLHPQLPTFVEAAHRAGMRTRIQTNAILCGRAGLAEALAKAGLDEAFVSLHGSNAERSDHLTGAPGTFEQTLAGVDALLEAGVAVRLNCVITGESHDDLPALARLVATRFGSRVRLCLSLAHASTDLVPRTARIVPRFRDIRGSIDDAIDVLDAAGVAWDGFDGQCGMPLCLADPRWLDAELVPPLEGENPPRGFYKNRECAECVWDDRCVGLRKSYVAIHGTAELRPVRASQM